MAGKLAKEGIEASVLDLRTLVPLDRKALLAAAVTFADEVGAEHIMTSVLPQMRETQRFYARLGFAPVVVRRSAAVSTLRRRLAPAGSPTVNDSLLARRRTLRRVRAAVARVGD